METAVDDPQESGVTDRETPQSQEHRILTFTVLRKAFILFIKAFGHFFFMQHLKFIIQIELFPIIDNFILISSNVPLIFCLPVLICLQKATFLKTSSDENRVFGVFNMF